MNVGELREKLKDFHDDLPVVVVAETDKIYANLLHLLATDATPLGDKWGYYSEYGCCDSKQRFTVLVLC